MLTPLVAFAREQRMAEPGLIRFVPDLVEALVACGRLAEAEDHLAWYEANAERLERVSASGSGRALPRLPRRRRRRSPNRARRLRTRARPATSARRCRSTGADAACARRRASARERTPGCPERPSIAARHLFASPALPSGRGAQRRELARIGGRAPSTRRADPGRGTGRGARRSRPDEPRGGRVALPQHAHRGGSPLPHLRKLGVRSRFELARRLGIRRSLNRASRVVPPFFARPPLPPRSTSHTSRIADPERRRKHEDQDDIRSDDRGAGVRRPDRGGRPGHVPDGAPITVTDERPARRVHALRGQREPERWAAGCSRPLPAQPLDRRQPRTLDSPGVREGGLGSSAPVSKASRSWTNAALVALGGGLVLLLAVVGASATRERRRPILR